MDRGVWQATVHAEAELEMTERLFTFSYYQLRKNHWKVHPCHDFRILPSCLWWHLTSGTCGEVRVKSDRGSTSQPWETKCSRVFIMSWPWAHAEFHGVLLKVQSQEKYQNSIGCGSSGCWGCRTSYLHLYYYGFHPAGQQGKLSCCCCC